MSVYAVPQIPTPPDTDDITALREYIQKLANVTAMAMKELDWLLNGNMDVKNIRANSIVAKLINVDQLSAISANLGTITAGLLQAVTIISSTITGSLIQTAASGTYPRTAISSSDNFLIAQKTVSSHVRIDPGLSDPAIVFDNGSVVGAINAFSLFTNTLLIQSTEYIDLKPGLGYAIRLTDWDELYSTDDGQNLQQALDAKANSFSGVTGSFYVSDTSGGAVTRKLNFTNGVLTSTA